MKRKTVSAMMIILSLTAISTVAFNKPPVHVFANTKRRTYIIAVDAMRGDYAGCYYDGLNPANGYLTPNINWLASQGANYTNCIDVLPALTATNHVAIVTSTTAGTSGILGAGGKFCGLDPSNHTAVLHRFVHDDLRVETVYDMIKSYSSSSKTAVVTGKCWVGDLFNDANVTYVIYPNASASKDPYSSDQPDGYIMGGPPDFVSLYPPIYDNVSVPRYYIPSASNRSLVPRLDSSDSRWDLLNWDPLHPYKYNNTWDKYGLDASDLPSDEWIMDEAIKLVNNDTEDPDFMYILLANMDEAGHFYGSFMDQNVPDLNNLVNPDAMRDQLNITDYQIGKFIKNLNNTGKLDNSIIVVTADHGMSSMKNASFSVDVRKILNDTGIDMRADDTSFHAYNASGWYDWCCSEGPDVYIYNVSPNYVQTIKSILENYAIAGTDQKPVWQVLDTCDQFSGVNDITNRPYDLYCGDYNDVKWPSLIVFLKPNYMATMYRDEIQAGLNGFMLAMPLPPGADVPLMPGAHGTYSEQHVPLILEGPGIPQGITNNTQVSTLDIIPTICDLNGWPKPPKFQGTFLPSDMDVGVTPGKSYYDNNSSQIVVTPIYYTSGSRQTIDAKVDLIEVFQGMFRRPHPSSQPWAGEFLDTLESYLGSTAVQVTKPNSNKYSAKFDFTPVYSTLFFYAAVRPAGFRDPNTSDNEIFCGFAFPGKPNQPGTLNITIKNPSSTNSTTFHMGINTTDLPPGWYWTLNPPPNSPFVVPPGGSKDVNLTITPSLSAMEGDVGHVTIYVMDDTDHYVYMTPEYFVAIDSLPPSVSMVHAEENMRVTANVTDSTTPIKKALLLYWTGAEWQNATMGLIGNNTYQATIGPFQDEQKVEYNITAEDMAGNVANAGPFYYQVSSTWPMFRHDLQHTGLSSPEAPNTNATVWTFHTGSRVDSSPAVTDGMVFVGSNDSRVYALNAYTGSQMWNHTTGNSVTSSPAVADGMVFVGSNDGFVDAFNETTGNPMWSRYIDGAVISSPAVEGGKVFVGSLAGGIFALNETNGNIKWTFAAGEVHSSPAVADGMVFVGSYDNRVFALPEEDPDNDGIISPSEVIWSYATGGPVESSPVVAYGKVFIGSWDNELYALNEVNGQLIWSYATTGAIHSSPAAGYGKVLVGSGNGKLYCLDALATAPVELWEFPTAGCIYSSPAIADSKVFFGACDGKVYALNLTDGQQLWNYTTGGLITSSPAVAYSKVFVGSADSKIYALGDQADIAITNITLEETEVFQGSVVSIDVNVTNEAQLKVSDTVGIWLIDGTNAVNDGTQAVTLDTGTSKALTFAWDTTGVPEGNYTVSAYAAIVAGEIDTANNAYVDGIVTVRIPDHEIAVTDVTPFKMVVCQGYSMNISITVANRGKNQENFNVTAYANDTATGNVEGIGTFTNVTVSIGTSVDLTLEWNTTGFPISNYTVSACADPVQGEINTENNNYTDGWVNISMVGDVTGPSGVPDKTVNLMDVYKVAMQFGSSAPTWDPYWGPVCDINNDATVNLIDYYRTCMNFGQTIP
jgi:outer membrane protein assembly factor BamB/arylsulfatase A-like enzyme